jgi:hypothetical protein
MVVRFGMDGDASGALDFLARASRPSLLDSIRAELATAGPSRHLNGTLLPAAGGENLGWNWVYAFNDWTLAEVSAEVCDASPQYVHDHRDRWLLTVGHYCPWGAYVKDTAWVN